MAETRYNWTNPDGSFKCYSLYPTPEAAEADGAEVIHRNGRGEPMTWGIFLREEKVWDNFERAEVTRRVYRIVNVYSGLSHWLGGTESIRVKEA